MVDPVSTTISVLALVISGITMWMNVLRRGALRMTRPTFISFNYDQVGRNGRLIKPKIFVRGLLYSTGARGRVVQNMFVTLRLGDSKHDFTVWGHGNTSLSRGSAPTGIKPSLQPFRRFSRIPFFGWRICPAWPGDLARSAISGD